MAGIKQRYKIQDERGHIRTVTAQGHKSAKDVFIVRYQPEPGEQLIVWPQGEPWNKKNMRV